MKRPIEQKIGDSSKKRQNISEILAKKEAKKLKNYVRGLKLNTTCFASGLKAVNSIIALLWFYYEINILRPGISLIFFFFVLFFPGIS